MSCTGCDAMEANRNANCLSLIMWANDRHIMILTRLPVFTGRQHHCGLIVRPGGEHLIKQWCVVWVGKWLGEWHVVADKANLPTNASSVSTAVILLTLPSRVCQTSNCCYQWLLIKNSPQPSYTTHRFQPDDVECSSFRTLTAENEALSSQRGSGREFTISLSAGSLRM